MKYFFIPCLLLTALCLFSSCNNHIYVPNTVNAPLLKEKHEFKGSISPTNIQGAFALTRNIAIMANGQYVYRFSSDNESDLFIDDKARGGIIEGAIGYFTPLDPKQLAVFDVYAGYGNGTFRTVHSAYTASAPTREMHDYLLRSHFNKFFIQPSIGFVHPVVETSFSSRLSLLRFYGLFLGPRVYENHPNQRDSYLKIANKARLFYEPAFTVRVGYKYVKFQMQLMFSVPMGDAVRYGYSADDYFQQVALGVGASVNIARWYDSFGKKH